jgi:hypothetical protein
MVFDVLRRIVVLSSTANDLNPVDADPTQHNDGFAKTLDSRYLQIPILEG